MGYNRSGYGRMAYARSASAAGYFDAGVAQIVGDASSALMKRTMELAGSAVIAGNGTGHLASGVDFGGSAAMAMNAEGRLNVPRNLAGTAAIVGSASSADLSLYASDVIRLEGINLAPGDVLVIDTEKVTVERNGVSVIEYWGTGSVPFRLASGENSLAWADSGSSRNIGVTVVWRDRWI